MKEGKWSALQDKTWPFSVCGTATKLVCSRVYRLLLPRNFVHTVQGDPRYHNNRKWLLFALRRAAAANRPEKRALFLELLNLEWTLQLEFTADFHKWGISVQVRKRPFNPFFSKSVLKWPHSVVLKPSTNIRRNLTGTALKAVKLKKKSNRQAGIPYKLCVYGPNIVVRGARCSQPLCLGQHPSRCRTDTSQFFTIKPFYSGSKSPFQPPAGGHPKNPRWNEVMGMQEGPPLCHWGSKWMFWPIFFSHDLFCLCSSSTLNSRHIALLYVLTASSLTILSTKNLSTFSQFLRGDSLFVWMALTSWFFLFSGFFTACRLLSAFFCGLSFLYALAHSVNGVNGHTSLHEMI